MARHVPRLAPLLLLLSVGGGRAEFVEILNTVYECQCAPMLSVEAA